MESISIGNRPVYVSKPTDRDGSPKHQPIFKTVFDVDGFKLDPNTISGDSTESSKIFDA